LRDHTYSLRARQVDTILKSFAQQQGTVSAKPQTALASA